MGYQTVSLGTFIITSSGSALTNALLGCEDAERIQVAVNSTVVGVSFQVQVSLLNTNLSTVGQVASTEFYGLQAVTVTSSIVSTGSISCYKGNSITLPVSAFNQIRLAGSSVETSGTVVGYALKQIRV